MDTDIIDTGISVTNITKDYIELLASRKHDKKAK